MAFTTLEVSIKEAVAVVTLNRPEVRNAFNAVMTAELTLAFRDLGSRDDLRAIVLRGSGASFSAGADANWMRESLSFSPEENLLDAQRLSDMLSLIDTVPQPVIGRVHGAALGGGMGLMAVCDIVVAADNALFGFTETKLGIIPAVISRFVIPKVGESWTRALFLTGERFTADLAQRIGLVHWIAPEARLDATVEAKVSELLAAGPIAARAAKGLITDLRGLNPGQTRELTSRRIADLRTTPEAQEGLRAFLEKRHPSWRPDV